MPINQEMAGLCARCPHRKLAECMRKMLAGR